MKKLKTHTKRQPFAVGYSRVPYYELSYFCFLFPLFLSLSLSPFLRTTNMTKWLIICCLSFFFSSLLCLLCLLWFLFFLSFFLPCQIYFHLSTALTLAQEKARRNSDIESEKERDFDILILLINCVRWVILLRRNLFFFSSFYI